MITVLFQSNGQKVPTSSFNIMFYKYNQQVTKVYKVCFVKYFMSYHPYSQALRSSSHPLTDSCQ